MDKEEFLRLQYLRMLNSDEFVAEQWRSSVDRFITDMWDRTPTKPAARFLAPVDAALGFSPDNVEWQFPRIKQRPTKAPKADPIVEPTKAERKAIKAADAAAAKEAKRKAIAEEYARWELLSAIRQRKA